MLLIQSNTWYGPSSEGDTDSVGTRTIEAWVSSREASEALTLLRQYEEIFRRLYRTSAVNFHVISIQEIPDLTVVAMEAGRLRSIEIGVWDLQREFRERVASA